MMVQEGSVLRSILLNDMWPASSWFALTRRIHPPMWQGNFYTLLNDPVFEYAVSSFCAESKWIDPSPGFAHISLPPSFVFAGRCFYLLLPSGCNQSFCVWLYDVHLRDSCVRRETYVYVNTRSIQNKNDIYPECVSLLYVLCGMEHERPGSPAGCTLILDARLFCIRINWLLVKKNMYFLKNVISGFFVLYFRRLDATELLDRRNVRMAVECAAVTIQLVKSSLGSSRNRSCRMVTIWWPSCPKERAISTSLNSSRVATI